MKHIPPRIVFSGDKEAAQRLKGKALKLWGSFTNEIAAGQVQSNAVKRKFQNGVILGFSYFTDPYNQRTGVIDIYVPPQGGENEYAGFIFLPRYTAQDEIDDPTHIEGEIKDSIKYPGQSMRNWLRTNKDGFVDIVEDTGFTAGYQYWTDKKATLSWESNENSISPSTEIPWNILVPRSRFDGSGQIYYNGKKAGHRDPDTVYAAKVGGNILCLLQGGLYLTTMYTNLKGDYWKYKSYYGFILKKAFINAKGTKLVIIAIIGVNTDYPEDFVEAVVEFDIIIQKGNFSEPIVLEETSRIEQYGWSCVTDTVSAARFIDVDVPEAEALAFVPPADIITESESGRLIISQSIDSYEYGETEVYYRKIETCDFYVYTDREGNTMLPDNGNGAEVTVLGSVFYIDGVPETLSGYDEMFWLRGESIDAIRSWFISSSKEWSIGSLITTTNIYRERPDPEAGEGNPASYLDTVRTVETQTFTSNLASTGAGRITDAWYDKNDVLKLERIKSTKLENIGVYEYTVIDPYNTFNMSVDCLPYYFEIDVDGNFETVNNASGVLCMRNNPYIENRIYMSITVTGESSGNESDLESTIYNATLSISRFDAKEKITFETINDVTSSYGNYLNSEYYPFDSPNQAGVLYNRLRYYVNDPSFSGLPQFSDVAETTSPSDFQNYSTASYLNSFFMSYGGYFSI